VLLLLAVERKSRLTPVLKRIVLMTVQKRMIQKQAEPGLNKLSLQKPRPNF